MTDQPDDAMLAFVVALEGHKVLLSKSAIPPVMAKKKQSIREFSSTVGMEEKAAIKKIQNLKARVKAYYDLNKTGNKPIKPLPWMKKLKQLMDEDESNPTFHGFSRWWGSGEVNEENDAIVTANAYENNVSGEEVFVFDPLGVAWQKDTCSESCSLFEVVQNRFLFHKFFYNYRFSFHRVYMSGG